MNTLHVRMKHSEEVDTHHSVSRIRKTEEGNLIISFVDEEKSDIIYLSPTWEKVEYEEQ